MRWAGEGDIAVAAFYCDSRNQQEQTTANIIGAILKQLVDPPCPQRGCAISEAANLGVAHSGYAATSHPTNTVGFSHLSSSLYWTPFYKNLNHNWILPKKATKRQIYNRMSEGAGVEVGFTSSLPQLWSAASTAKLLFSSWMSSPSRFPGCRSPIWSSRLLNLVSPSWICLGKWDSCSSNWEPVFLLCGNLPYDSSLSTSFHFRWHSSNLSLRPAIRLIRFWCLCSAVLHWLCSCSAKKFQISSLSTQALLCMGILVLFLTLCTSEFPNYLSRFKIRLILTSNSVNACHAVTAIFPITFFKLQAVESFDESVAYTTNSCT